MAKKLKPDFIETKVYSRDQFEKDQIMVREYCTKTNCKTCLLIKNGFDACKTSYTDFHPLDDAEYVRRCAEVLQEVSDA